MYFLFAGESFYPMGGMEDLVGTFPTYQAAREALADLRDEDGDTMYYDWYQIATIVDGKLEVAAEFCRAP